MRLNHQVWQRKFDEQVRRVREREHLLQRMGCFLVSCEAPEIRVLWAPPPGVLMSLPLLGRVEANGNCELMVYQLPQLASRSFGVRIGLDDYDQRAPSVTIANPYTWEPLAHNEFPGALNQTGAGLQRVWLFPHPSTGRPFLCLRGFREYHEHPEHDGDPWPLQRRDVDAFYVLNAIHRTCVLNIRPQVSVAMTVALNVQAVMMAPAPDVVAQGLEQADLDGAEPQAEEE